MPYIQFTCSICGKTKKSLLFFEPEYDKIIISYFECSDCKDKFKITIEPLIKPANLLRRFQLKYGKFGAYFYDHKVKEHLTLLQIMKRLNMEFD